MSFDPKVGIFLTPTATGTESGAGRRITGLAAAAKAMIHVATKNTAINERGGMRYGIGFSDGGGAHTGTTPNFTAHNLAQADGRNNNVAASTGEKQRSYNFDQSVLLFDEFTPATLIEGRVNTFDSDGVAYNWGKVDAGNQYETPYILFTGSDITNVKSGMFKLNTSVGAGTEVNISFDPDIIFSINCGSASDPNANPVTGRNCFGVAKKTSAGWVVASGGANATSPTKTRRYQRKEDSLICGAAIDSTTPAIKTEWKVSATSANGFTPYTVTTDGEGDWIYFLALKGGSYSLGSFLAPTTGTTPFDLDITYSPTFVGKLVILASVNDVAQTTNQAGSRLSIGAFTGTSARWSWWGADSDAVTTTIGRSQVDDTRCLRLATESSTPAPSATDNFVCDVGATAFPASGQFRLSVKTRNTTAYEVVYLVVGDTVAAATGSLFTANNYMDLSGLGSAGPFYKNPL